MLLAVLISLGIIFVGCSIGFGVNAIKDVKNMINEMLKELE